MPAPKPRKLEPKLPRGFADRGPGEIRAVERMMENGSSRTDLVSYVRETARAVSRDLGAIPW